MIAEVIAKKSLAARIYRGTADIVERIVPRGLRTPAHYLSRRITGRLELEHDVIMAMLSPGATAVDVGANIGIFTFGFLARGANVHAIEPQPGCASQIRAFYAMGFPVVRAPGGRGKLEIHVEALGNETGSAVLYVPLKRGRPDDESASLAPSGGEALCIEVPVRRLDDYALQDVQAIKVDVEGMEVPALEGAVDTIARCRPALLVEIEQRHHPENISEVFAKIHAVLGHRYRTCFMGSNGTLRPLSDFNVERDQLTHHDNPLARSYVRNFFFLPQ